MPFLEVDAAYTSQRCPRCGHTERANRPGRCRRRGQRAQPGTLGVGVRHRTRTLSLTSVGGGWMRPVTVLS
ncbi:zinc ribbon domain-containing protein [Streptomyces sp. NPDC004237]|uniref:zinc ribbon domain-containing protein n=1 Tax=Streptomyces sp. NPDC004237 TaxID=3154455 RepID=UPI0033A48F09